MQGSSFRLIVRRGPQPNQIYELTKGVVTLGRDITNDIVINDPEVSRHHCRLTQGGGGYTVEDLGSTNGTFVNGQRLTGARPLQPGDMLGLGETVTLAYESAAAGMGMEASAQPAILGASAPPDYSAAGPASGYTPPAQPSVPPQGGYPPTAAVPPQQPYAAQSSLPYDEYEYPEGSYENAGPGRWLVLGCGCFLVLCIVTSVIGGIIIDAKCWWDDIPVISETFDLGVKPDATCR